MIIRLLLLIRSPERHHQTPRAQASQQTWEPNGQNVTASGHEPRACYLGSGCPAAWTLEPLQLAVFGWGRFHLGHVPRPPSSCCTAVSIRFNGFQTTREQGKTPAS